MSIEDELSYEQKQFAQTLWETQAFKLGEFTQRVHEKKPDLPPAPYRISFYEKDLPKGSLGFLSQEASAIINHHLYQHHSDNGQLAINAQRIVGFNSSSEVIAFSLSQRTGIPYLGLTRIDDGHRPSPNGHITNRSCTEDVMVVGNSLITGDSSLYTRDLLAKNNFSLAHLAVAIDHEQGGLTKLREAGVNVSAALTITQIIDLFLNRGYIEPHTKDSIKWFIEQARAYV